MRSWRTIAVVATLLAAGLAVPVAWAMTDDDPALLELPQPARVMDQPSAAATDVVVKLREGADTRALTSRGARVLGDVPGTGYLRARPGSGGAARLVEQLRADPTVEQAAVDYRRQAFVSPNDPYYVQGPNAYWTTRLVEAWDRVNNASGQIIAVVDTGVDATHPDLAGRVLPGYNAATAPDPSIAGHGTFVAGIVAANANNNRGIAGVAWNASVLPVQVFSGKEAFDSDVAEGVAWAVDQGARVINLSLGGPEESPLLHDAIKYAVSHDVVVVAASGNTFHNEPQYPAAYPEVLAVGATDNVGALVDFSTYGDWVDLAAPGFRTISTYPGNSYAIGSGTSFSAPIVAGIAALLRTREPRLSAAEVADRLRITARDAGPRGVDPYYGHGVVDAARALGASAVADLPFEQEWSTLDTPGDANNASLPSIADVMRTEGDVDWYRYQATSAQVVTFQVVSWARGHGHDVDPVLEIFNSDLGRVAAVDEHPSGVVETITLPLSQGTYYLRVSNYNGTANRQEAYGFNVITTASPSAVTPAPDEQELVSYGLLLVGTGLTFNSSYGLPLDASIRFGIRGDIDPSTVNSDTVRLVETPTWTPTPTVIPATITYDSANKGLFVKPVEPYRKGLTYRLVIDGVKTLDNGLPVRPFSTWFYADNPSSLAPAALTGVQLRGEQGTTVRASYAIPAGDPVELVIRAAEGTVAPDSPTAGTGVYAGIDPHPVIWGQTPGRTYSFGLWYRDRWNHWSPGSTATLHGASLGMELTSGASTVSTTDALHVATTLNSPTVPTNGQPVALLALCRGGATTPQAVATPITDAAGAIALETTQTRPTCAYHWQFQQDGFMGAVSTTVTVTATLPVPGNPPPRER